VNGSRGSPEQLDSERSAKVSLIHHPLISLARPVREEAVSPSHRQFVEAVGGLSGHKPGVVASGSPDKVARQHVSRIGDTWPEPICEEQARNKEASLSRCRHGFLRRGTLKIGGSLIGSPKVIH
jgi:hypothetical protein